MLEYLLWRNEQALTNASSAAMPSWITATSVHAFIGLDAAGVRTASWHVPPSGTLRVVCACLTEDAVRGEMVNVVSNYDRCQASKLFVKKLNKFISKVSVAPMELKFLGFIAWHRRNKMQWKVYVPKVGVMTLRWQWLWPFFTMFVWLLLPFGSR